MKPIQQRLSNKGVVTMVLVAATFLTTTTRPAVVRAFSTTTTTRTSMMNHGRIAAFVRPHATTTRRFLSSSQQQVQDIAQMRAGEIKAELESYGISTKAFLEKSELVAALQKARDEGLTPKQQQQETTTQKPTTTTDSTTTTQQQTSTSSSSSREERLQQELDACSKLRAAELKKELRERGVNIAALFEKSELVQALAEARVDGKTRQNIDSNDDPNAEGYAEYSSNQVEVLTDDTSGPRQKQSEQQQQQQQQSSPFGGGGGGDPFGGGMPGGMGGIADMLKNMGGGMGGGAGGGSGAGNNNPFGANIGDMMGKAKRMMQNPKVVQLMQKAQGNPRVSRILQECMANPSAVYKYQNDPEVRDMVNELKKYM